MRILVTGAAGFVGKAVVGRLAANGHIVTGLHRTMPCLGAHFPAIQHVQGDILDLNSFSTELEGQKKIVHLAARAHIQHDTSRDSMAAFRAINRDATLALAEAGAAKGLEHFIFVSSIGVNGNTTPAGPFSESDVVDPRDPYAITKYEAEQGLMVISKRTGLKVTIVRPPLIYGPGAPGNMRRLLQLVRTIPLLPLASASAGKNFLSVDNLADVIAGFVTTPDVEGVFLPADNEKVTVAEVVRAMARGMQRSLVLAPVPAFAVKAASFVPALGRITTQLFRPLTIDNSKTRDVLGWSPRVSTLDGVAAMAATYASSPW